MSELTSLSLTALSAEIRAGRVSPLEVTEACLRRIEARDGALNSFITVTADSALAEARERTEELAAGRWRGPLHGVPLALKDLFQTAGVRTTSGSAALRDWVPDQDATVVRRLREAGAVLLGKQNMHEHAFGATSENPHFGAVRNPHDTSRIAGGSSGGSAAAVADGLCFGALGTDTGGSVRSPAALCGLVGVKPTYGRVSRAGVLPLSWTLDHVGPITHTVSDAAVLLEAISGYDGGDPSSAREPVPPFSSRLEGGIQGLKLAVPREHFWKPVESQLRDAVRATIDRLEQAGAVVDEISLPSLASASAAQSLIVCAEAAAYHRERLATHYAEYGEDVRMRLLQGLCINAVDYLDAQRARSQVRREFLAALRSYDAFLTPTVCIGAPPLGTRSAEVEGVSAPPLFFLLRNTAPFNLTGLPAMTVPCGLAGGLPVGLQIAARPWEEATLLRIARVVEEAAT